MSVSDLVFGEICVDRLITGVKRDKIVTKYLYLSGLPRLNQQSSYYRKMHFKYKTLQTRVKVFLFQES